MQSFQPQMFANEKFAECSICWKYIEIITVIVVSIAKILFRYTAGPSCLKADEHQSRFLHSLGQKPFSANFFYSFKEHPIIKL